LSLEHGGKFLVIVNDEYGALQSSPPG